ncbi:6695_t:CDS:1, partial [Racocetra fulgida]
MVLVNNEQALVNYQIDDDDSQACEELYAHLIEITGKTLEILKDQQNKKNYKWVKNIKKNFNSIEQITSEIASFKQRRTMSCTFKDHLHNTLFFN